MSIHGEDRRAIFYPKIRRKFYPVLWRGINIDKLKDSLFILSVSQVVLFVVLKEVFPGWPDIVGLVLIALFFFFCGFSMICSGYLSIYRKHFPMGGFSLWGKPAVIQGAFTMVMGTGGILLAFWLVIRRLLNLP